MRRIMLRVAYDGTNYSGWQLQPNGDTIEARLNEAICALTKENVTVTGASRTDAGVHSLGNVAVFDTESRIPADKFPFALNTMLPQDIRVQSACEVANDFHPRKSNSIKTYEYRILNRTFELPTERLYSYFYYGKLDLEAMRQAAAYLVGEHDFAAFCSSGSQAEDTIRRIYSCEVSKEGDVIVVHVSGNGFLYNMVRIIAGTLIEVGAGRFAPNDVKKMLVTRERSDAGRKVPACGLTMVSLEYGPESFPQHIVSESWEYVMDRKTDEEGSTYVTIELLECADRNDADVLLGKLANHAYREGAEKVFARGDFDWMQEGHVSGFYVFRAKVEIIPNNDEKWYYLQKENA